MTHFPQRTNTYNRLVCQASLAWGRRASHSLPNTRRLWPSNTYLGLDVDHQHGCEWPPSNAEWQRGLVVVDCFQQGAYLEEIRLSPQQRQVGKAVRQVQEAGAQVVQNVPERFAVAVNEDVSSVVPEHRDLPGEHGPQHRVAAACECVQGRGEYFSADVQSHRVLKGAPVVIRWVQVEHLERLRSRWFSWRRPCWKVQDPFALCRNSGDWGMSKRLPVVSEKTCFHWRQPSGAEWGKMWGNLPALLSKAKIYNGVWLLWKTVTLIFTLCVFFAVRFFLFVSGVSWVYFPQDSQCSSPTAGLQCDCVQVERQQGHSDQTSMLITGHFWLRLHQNALLFSAHTPRSPVLTHTHTQWSCLSKTQGTG